VLVGLSSVPHANGGRHIDLPPTHLLASIRRNSTRSYQDVGDALHVVCLELLTFKADGGFRAGV